MTLELRNEERAYIAKIVRKYGEMPPPRIRVMTCHQCKGTESDLVVVCSDMLRASYEEYQLGGQEGRESETRLFYVAVTRARDTIVLVQPETRRHFVFPAVKDVVAGLTSAAPTAAPALAADGDEIVIPLEGGGS